MIQKINREGNKMSKKRYMICPVKAAGESDKTGNKCGHAVKHKEKLTCKLFNSFNSKCRPCVPYDSVKRGKHE